MRVNFNFISTAKKLPEKDGNYLTIDECGRVYPYSYCCDYGEFNTSKWSHDYPIHGIKFWASIPEDLLEISRELRDAYLDRLREETNE